MFIKFSTSMQETNDEDYKQISYSNDDSHHDKDVPIRLNLQNSFRLFFFIFFFLTSQSNALPIHHQVNSSLLPFPAAMVQVIDHSTPSILPPFNSYKVYRHLPLPIYSDGNVRQVYRQTNFNNNQQLKRERYRRTMIDRMFSLFDEDVNGQLSKDELYSLSLRLNIFPKFHRFLKQTTSRK